MQAILPMIAVIDAGNMHKIDQWQPVSALARQVPGRQGTFDFLIRDLSPAHAGFRG
jgi:hypothetical protein